MLDVKYKLKDSVEVFSNPVRDNQTSLIQFYRISTRRSVYIESSEQTLRFLALLDGNKTLNEIIESCNFDSNSVIKLADFLLKNGLIYDIEEFNNYQDDKFVRQITYFDDLLDTRDARQEHEKLRNKKIVIFGVGSVGSSMAILLARMGIKNFVFIDYVFIDYKKVNKSHFTKHLYCNNTNIGNFKTDALKQYLLDIDNEINIQTFNEKILPQSNLKKFILDDTDLIINTADEPYIGHISIKIGRYAWDIGAAFYVGGGFDAHSMSTGEMIIPKKTPCIDCYSNSFKVALKDYKPTYITKPHVQKTQETNNIILGGPGSIGACSLFSASFGIMRIIYYLLGIECDVNSRGEYLIDQGIIKYTELERVKRTNCKVCNNG